MVAHESKPQVTAQKTSKLGSYLSTSTIILMVAYQSFWTLKHGYPLVNDGFMKRVLFLYARYYTLHQNDTDDENKLIECVYAGVVYVCRCKRKKEDRYRS